MGPPGDTEESERPDARTAAERVLDDNDRQAFLKAEAVLREEQLEPARAFAERYREALYDLRQGRGRPAR
ncbi:MAG: hypothetical protein QM765_26295 [Myxococcales bacterium]